MSLICETCGNPFDFGERVCPYCEQPVAVPISSSSRSITPLLWTVNLKAGLPTVDQALQHLDQALDDARHRSIRIVKLIHGYGSTGTGGRIRAAVRSRLMTLKFRGEIRGVLEGEEFARGSRDAAAVLKSFPRLKDDEDYHRRNRGITLVIL